MIRNGLYIYRFSETRLILFYRLFFNTLNTITYIQNNLNSLVNSKGNNNSNNTIMLETYSLKLGK